MTIEVVPRESGPPMLDPGNPISGDFMFWAGGSMVVVRSLNQYLWIDPFFGQAANPKITRRAVSAIGPDDAHQAHVFLITHEHRDHCDPEAVRALSNGSSTAVFAPGEAAKALRAGGIDDVCPVRAGDRLEVGAFVVNVLRSADDFAIEAVSYVVESQTARVAHFGDTGFDPDVFSQVGDLDVTLAFLNFGETLLGNKVYLNQGEFEDAVGLMNADTVVPIHWDLWVESYLDASAVDWIPNNITGVEPGTGFLVHAGTS